MLPTASELPGAVIPEADEVELVVLVAVVLGVLAVEVVVVDVVVAVEVWALELELPPPPHPARTIATAPVTKAHTPTREIRDLLIDFDPPRLDKPAEA